ncbi:hypothetical protein [Trichlorobacter ammonificans]|uniref:Lipoprotein n=1 Tax=Trichlorobacter ammonificans TaxID=2916410 RepID=A0ABM9DBT2_9BACT|nr:hypothetical protein [Trichlorobacter ammonificans]CAH2032275.1 putative Lipoprotein [Trichlorobacter ammonificans]
MRVSTVCLFCGLLLFLSGCAGYRTMNRQEACDKVIKTYNRMIRWQEAEKAALTYVDRSQRDRFVGAAESLRRRNVTMADMRILASECRAEHRSAEAVVEFDYFVLPDNRLKTVTDRQKWLFREESSDLPDQTEGWKLTTPLPEFK